MTLPRLIPLLCLLLDHTLTGAPARGRELAQEILNAAGVRGGLVVHLGCGTGELTAAFRPNSSYLVHGLDTNAANVDQARRRIQSLGLYGPVSVDHWDGAALPYCDNLVNLIVCENMGNLSRDELLRVLVPNGVALMPEVRGQRSEVSMRAQQVEIGGRAWTKIVKPWPSNIDEWTHFLHGPDNNAVAKDTAIGPPSRVQWAAGPMWSREHDVTPNVFAPVSAKGRLFYILGEGPVGVVDKRLPDKHSLVARDAFNGVVLWKRRMSDWYSSRIIWGHIPVHAQRRLVAVGDRVYATLGLQAPVTAMDAATGKTIREYKGTKFTSEIVCDGEVLGLVIRKTNPLDGLLAGRDGKRFRRGYTGPRDGGQALMAVDAETGARLWRQERHCMPLTLALSGGKAFFVEAKSVVAVDLKSGRELWRTPFPARTLVVHGDIVLAATDRNTTAYRASKTVTLVALSVADGKRVWTAQGECLPNFNFFYAPIDIYVAQGLVWGLARNLEWNKKPGSGEMIGLDIATGKVAKRLSLAGAFTPGHHVRCYKGKATEKFLLFNKRGIEFVDIEEDAPPVQCQWVRGVCRYGILPCNGLIYAPPHACACYPGAQLNGFFALAAGSAVRGQKSEVRRVRGPAFATIANRKSKIENPSDWPTYRHDAARSGCSAARVPARLMRAWEAELGGKLSAPTVAEGKVFVASVDAHTVHALDASTGREVWRYVAGARVDSPPTVRGGLAVFGSRDGWVTCLRADDGRVVWRFRGAPEERRIGAFGQLESPWPIHGSVLVQDGTVYFAAGRSSFLDGGIFLYGLDLATGKVLYTTTLAGRELLKRAPKITAGRMPGAVPDILVSDGTSLYMRQIRLSPKLGWPTGKAAFSWGIKSDTHLLAGSGMLDDSLFSRTVWKYGRRVDRSQLLVFDGGQVYGFRVYWGISWNCPVSKLGGGYLLFSEDVSKPVPRPPKKPRQLNRIPYERYAWHQRIPIRVSAMALAASPGDAGKHLFVAGSPDEILRSDPLAAFEGRAGGRLWVVSADDGRKLAAYPLESPPVWNGLAAAGGRLYIASAAGKVVCMSAN